jgi:hypothetical protein|tara:strand:+ start:2509 stop:3618 length:1110 start_codon:yes stop_codon:yes gene_type:complete
MTNRSEAPSNAFTLSGECQVNFSHSDGESNSHKVTLLARSSQPIEHWYWGNVVHDLDGMRLTKDRIPLDFNHDANEIIGYLDEFEVTKEGLVCRGELTPFKDDDRASEIIFKAKAGVPWEASIAFGGDGIKVENIAKGASAKVNGYELEGEAAVIRSWPFRGCAICPQGADENTSSSVFSGGDPVVVEFINGDEEMSEDRQDVAEDVQVEDQLDEQFDDAVEEVAEDLEDNTDAVEEILEDIVDAVDEKIEEVVELSNEDARAELSQFMEKFGVENGAKWFAEGKTEADATALHYQAIEQERDELRNQVAELTIRLEAVERGEDEPLSFSQAVSQEEEEAKARFNSFRESTGSDAIAAFASRFDRKISE